MILYLGIAQPPGAQSAVWDVFENGKGTTPTIQEAIDACAPGDTVLVWPGTYYENLNFWGKDVFLVSKAGREATILDGSNSDAIIVIRDGVTSVARVCGFTLRNGIGYELGQDFRVGGAIYIGRSWPVICHNNFEGNEAREGGAIMASNEGPPFPVYPDLVIEENSFRGNKARTNGGAMRLGNVNAVVNNNVFESNSAVYDGGAVDDRADRVVVTYRGNQFLNNWAGDKGGAMDVVSWNVRNPQVVLDGNIFFQNTSMGSAKLGSGGAIRIGNRSGVITNNTIVNNDGRSNTGDAGGGISVGWDAQDVLITNNIIAFNQGAGISCYALRNPETLTLDNNIFWENDQGAIGELINPCPAEWHDGIWEVDPQFCDWKNGDFTVATTSPAINTGAIYGAYPDPHCGIAIQTEQTTWGRLKVRFGSEN